MTCHQANVGPSDDGWHESLCAGSDHGTKGYNLVVDDFSAETVPLTLLVATDGRVLDAWRGWFDRIALQQAAVWLAEKQVLPVQQ